jgi:hypothetical protein
MATQTFITLECDLAYKGCSKDVDVETHSMALDGTPVEFEACPHCWDGALSLFTEVVKAGREPSRIKKVSQAKNVFDFPGKEWKFTAHALERMGQRHITPDKACRAADYPDLTRGGRDANTQIRVRKGIKVLVDESRGLIVTVAREEDVDENVA